MPEINSVKGEPSYVVDVELLAKMQEKLDGISPLLPEKPAVGKNPCIFRLPQRFKAIKALSYEPQVVSIGPYCRDNANLGKMEELKWQCLAYSVNVTKMPLGIFLEGMCSLEKEARDCYSGTIDLIKIKSKDFLEMMVLDGCFIIQSLRFFDSIDRNEREVVKGHPFGRMNRVILQKIYADLLMLENQIPYLVLKKLFQISWKPSGGIDQPLPTIAVRMFSEILEIGSFDLEGEEISEPSRVDEYLHLLDLVRSVFIPPNRSSALLKENQRRLHLLELVQSIFIAPCRKEGFRQENLYRPLRTIPRISKLRRAGIKVNPRKKDRFLVVQFVQSLGVIEMPNISVNELMCSFLVNCVAFEQTYNTDSKHFSVYALFLDCLVNTAEDVEYLCDHRVIDNYIENDAVSFINNLGKDLTFDWYDSIELYMLCSGVNKYYQNRFHRQWTSFKGEYFDKPWLWFSGFLALVLLVLTFLQTYYTMHP